MWAKNMKKELNLQSNYRAIINKVLGKYTNLKCAVFGSRSKGLNKKYSDIDLLILDRKDIPINKIDFAKIKLDLVESDLPYIVDLHAISTINEDFYQKIKVDLILL